MIDLSTVVHAIVEALWWLVPLAVLVGFLRSPFMKGIFGELAVRLTSWLFLSRDKYRSIHNVTIPTPDSSTQIDHVIVSCFGIFAIETKNMRGWIFGGERQREWTQIIYKKKVRFQNPLHQNYKHVKALERILGVPANTIHSVVTLVGSATFKTDMPGNVTRGSKFVDYIKTFHEPLFSKKETAAIVERIESGRFEPTLATRSEHIRNVRGRVDPNAETRCPKCGEPMVLRTARRGSYAGERFWGCSGFPNCRMVQSARV